MKLTEKQKNCPYCHKSKNQLSLFTETNFNEKGMDRTVFYVDRITDENGKILARRCSNYCEMCGRPLNEEEEQ